MLVYKMLMDIYWAKQFLKEKCQVILLTFLSVLIWYL